MKTYFERLGAAMVALVIVVLMGVGLTLGIRPEHATGAAPAVAEAGATNLGDAAEGFLPVVGAEVALIADETVEVREIGEPVTVREESTYRVTVPVTVTITRTIEAEAVYELRL
jgi:hypothetical protein